MEQSAINSLDLVPIFRLPQQINDRSRRRQSCKVPGRREQSNNSPFTRLGFDLDSAVLKLVDVICLQGHTTLSQISHRNLCEFSRQDLHNRYRVGQSNDRSKYVAGLFALRKFRDGQSLRSKTRVSQRQNKGEQSDEQHIQKNEDAYLHVSGYLNSYADIQPGAGEAQDLAESG